MIPTTCRVMKQWRHMFGCLGWRGLSTGAQQQQTTFYEIRKYGIKPDKFLEFLQRTEENIHLRTAYSHMLGYWTVDHGELNQVVHIWPYESYTQRTGVRTALAKDAQWMDRYILKVLPILTWQQSEVAYLVPWASIQSPAGEGVYELVVFRMKPGGPAMWGKAFQAALTTHANVSYCTLVGVFHAEFGALNQVHVLWKHPSTDERAAGRHLAHQDGRVVAAVRESMKYIESQSNTLLIPTSFSPMK
uniref:protein NipSnap homolog 3B-like isoform X3 n=1 Tax=Myxine glutinosa TaxID=7769 RepID=UPI00358F7D67